MSELMGCATRCHCTGTIWKYCGVIELHSYDTLATQRSPKGAVPDATRGDSSMKKNKSLSWVSPVRGKSGKFVAPVTNETSGVCPQRHDASLSRGHFPRVRMQRKRRLQCQSRGRGWRTLLGWRILGVSARHYASPMDRIKMGILTWNDCEWV